MKYIYSVILVILLISCKHDVTKKLLISSKPDSIPKGMFTIANNFKEFDSFDIDPIPDITLNDSKKLFKYFVNYYIQKKCIQRVLDKYDSIPYPISSTQKFDLLIYGNQHDNSQCPSLDKYSISNICQGNIFGFIFNNEIYSNKNYNFVKKIFSEKIINKHKRDFFTKQDLYNHLGKNDTDRVEYFWKESASDTLYRETADIGCFSLKKVYFSKKYTAFIIDVKNGSDSQDGISLLCTYDNDGNFVDGIETGTRISASNSYIAPTYFYSYFDDDGFYHIVNVSLKTPELYERSAWKKVKTYKEITEHYKYKLSDEGTFILVNKKKKEEIKTIF